MKKKQNGNKVVIKNNPNAIGSNTATSHPMAEPWIPGEDNFMLSARKRSLYINSNTFLVAHFALRKINRNFALRKIFVKRAMLPDGGCQGYFLVSPPPQNFFPKSDLRPTIRTATPNIQTPAATTDPQSQRNTENYVDS